MAPIRLPFHQRAVMLATGLALPPFSRPQQHRISVELFLLRVHHRITAAPLLSLSLGSEQPFALSYLRCGLILV